MGGRVYDPTLARFLSTDPVVQQPHNLQNYNRYSYVLNNPVSYTDPTGYFIAGGVEVIATALVGVAASGTTVVVAAATGYGGVREIGRLAAKNKFGPELLQIAVVAGCIAATAGWGTPACIAAGSGLAAASVAKANGATNHEALRFGLRTAAVAYVSSFMMQGIANSGASIYAQIYGFGVTNAWASAAMGGDPLAGFVAGILAPYAGGPIRAGLVGGIASKLADGKFEHGFMLGAISYLARANAEVIRQERQIYVTGHRVFEAGPYHLAIEYTQGGDTMVLSAGSEGGVLVSRVNRPSDAPELNVMIGEVQPPAGMSAGAYFNSLQKVDYSYCDCVDYDLFPGIANSYNSNSYVHGLINATGGTSSVNFNGYFGGPKPLPSHYFEAP